MPVVLLVRIYEIRTHAEISPQRLRHSFSVRDVGPSDLGQLRAGSKAKLRHPLYRRPGLRRPQLLWIEDD